MTKGQIIYAETEARCRKDGGPLVEVIWQWHDKIGVSKEVFSPRVGYSTARDIEFNGGTVIEVNII